MKRRSRSDASGVSGSARTIACVFAHPDDEAFGPGGTIAKLAAEHDVSILSATKGEAGRRGERRAADLGSQRARELLASARILGVKEVYFLGFADGALSNNLYHRLASSIERRLRALRPEVIITHEPRGISGHLDHIAVSMVTTFVFHRLPFVQTLLYYCVTAERARAVKNYFIYFPPGYRRGDIDLTVDVRDVWPQKVAAMRAHASQRRDVRRILKLAARFPKEENFLVRTKEHGGGKLLRRLRKDLAVR